VEYDLDSTGWTVFFKTDDGVDGTREASREPRDGNASALT
jgi:hypothetical protein